MKHILITITAVLLVGCGESQLPKLPAFKASDILIHTAAEAGNIEAVKQHLAEGADVNARSVIDDTPLHSAAGEGHKEVVELLIANGADVNPNTSNVYDFSYDGRTPLDVAIGRKHPETIDHLRKHGGKTKSEL